jgi:Uncharacterised protein family (UPF0158)
MTNEQLNEIAENLDCGLRCFVHKDTADIRCIPDERQFGDFDQQAWEEDIKAIRKERKKYLEIERMTSQEEFGLMEEFVDLVDQKRLREQLQQVLSRPKPFRNFKVELEQAGPYREKWFAFRRTKMLEWVKNQLL